MKLQSLEAILLTLSMCALVLITYVQLLENAPHWKLLGCQVGVGVFGSMFLVLVGKWVWELVVEREE